MRRHDRRPDQPRQQRRGRSSTNYGNLLAIATAKTFAGNRLATTAPISSYGLGQSSGRLRKFFEKQAAKLSGLHLVPGTEDKELTNEQTGQGG